MLKSRIGSGQRVVLGLEGSQLSGQWGLVCDIEFRCLRDIKFWCLRDIKFRCLQLPVSALKIT
jgi:hypothetical protein